MGPILADAYDQGKTLACILCNTQPEAAAGAKLGSEAYFPVNG